MKGWENSFTGESEEGKVVLECPECGAEMRLVHVMKGRFYGCVRYPGCRTTHGCHLDGSPLGIPGNKETRMARSEAHRWFDAIWRSGTFTRSHAYKRMRYFLRLSKDECHIGRFSIQQCEQVIVYAKGICEIYNITPCDQGDRIDGR